ncbi:DNA/RNA helicase domain-containing protein [Nocardioides daphniae]|uniref:DNA/RNA helicase domain-containing protein n=1 Tax=Nocardioides daphniae TaxID=402297 RepID=UPI001EE81D21|nr:DNA/RNA helicase domain-containing protein [Nocardioides daphniae]
MRPADLSETTAVALVSDVRSRGRLYPLSSQMRVKAGDDYVGYVRDVLAGTADVPRPFEGYDLRFFDDVAQMQQTILDREAEHGLARLLAGFAWRWTGKHDPDARDVTVDGLALQWNTTDVDWVNSPTSIHEVGSIHTIQGYDLNYAGVIIGRDLRFDPSSGRIIFDRRHYHDPRGATNNRMLGITYSDDDILRFVRNIYAVLLTRGMRGTYVYVCDPALREHLRPWFSAISAD